MLKYIIVLIIGIAIGVGASYIQAARVLTFLSQMNYESHITNAVATVESIDSGNTEALRALKLSSLPCLRDGYLEVINGVSFGGTSDAPIPSIMDSVNDLVGDTKCVE